MLVNLLSPPTYKGPLIPAPPLTTNAPVVVELAAFVFVNVTGLFAVNDVNAAVPLVVVPMLKLLIDPTDPDVNVAVAVPEREILKLSVAEE